ncbi:hypothetical protein H0H87_010143 [Tephrocybe sp. NHM501043]|nr:hypothetical protein H0H87_010143 [Tephrocybe sp. NHM501043]
MPRPEITDLLGITYRQIPILAIGNDVYCDTSLIASALERRFTSSQGYGTIFPQSKGTGLCNTGAIQVFSKLYESNFLILVARCMEWDRFPEPFIQDRSLLFGAPIDPKVMIASQGQVMRTLSAQLALLEEQLSDGREWLFDSELPSLADVTIHFILTCLHSRTAPPAKALLNALDFPNIFSASLSCDDLPAKLNGPMQWLDRVSSHLNGVKSRQETPQVIDGDDAAELIISAPHEPDDAVGFDAQEAARLGFKFDDRVQVAPEATGKNFPTVGRLVGWSREQVVIEVKGEKGLLRCHFPHIAYTVTAA